MFESKKQKLLPWPLFVGRMVRSLFFAGIVVLIALAVGVLGYHFVAGFPWVDAFLDASMILTGMGPVGALSTTGAKLFAAAYALFSGLVFLTVMGVTLAPLLHRLLHKFHLEEEEQ